LILNLPKDFDKNNFKDLQKLLNDLKGEPYSINNVEDILNEVDKITITDQFESTKASVIENIDENKINLEFFIEETEKKFVEKINIFGNNVTQENVIRNQFEIDEGDPYNEILANKSINNLKSLNFFKSVDSETVEGKSPDLMVINVEVEEKPTGEISAGAGAGTSGGTVSFGIKENNYLGKGLTVLSNFTINEETLKGIFSVTNPNYKNSDKSVYFTGESIETDRLTAFGYKTNKTGFSVGTNFEFLNNLKLGIGNSNYYEKIQTDSTASARQKLQEGNYWDSFILLLV
jgi:outer membrane protein insertion porin family